MPGRKFQKSSAHGVYFHVHSTPKRGTVAEAIMATNNMQSEVDNILSQADERKKSSIKSIEIAKEVEPVIDVGNLLLLDQQPLALNELRYGTCHHVIITMCTYLQTVMLVYIGYICNINTASQHHITIWERKPQ